MQVNYNDDCLTLLSAPLATNSLKWSESFLSNTMLYNSRCKYEEPLRIISMAIDVPKVSLLKLSPGDYSFSPLKYPPTLGLVNLQD